MTTPLQVLLVEDGSLDAQIVKSILLTSDGEFECEVAGSLASALERTSVANFDAVLLDLNLPDSQGLDTFLTFQKSVPGVAIIALTAIGDDHLALEAVRRGAQDYLYKGWVTGSLLLRALRYAIERKHLHEGLRRVRDELEMRVAERTAELRALSNQLVEAQESERRKIARELHDEVGQVLTGLKLLLGTAVRQSEEERIESLLHAQNMVNELMGHVRDISLDLRPGILDDLGLLHALLWHIERYTKRTGILVDFTHKALDGCRFRSEVETSAFRIAQEALTNVARYAKVDRVGLDAWTANGTLTVQIQDCGVGFDVAAALRAHSSIGLAGMRERAELLNGSMTIDSGTGRGTCVTALFPLSVE